MNRSSGTSLQFIGVLLDKYPIPFQISFLRHMESVKKHLLTLNIIS